MGKSKNRNALALGIIAIGTVSLAGLGIYASNNKANAKPQVEQTASQKKPNIEVEVKPDDEREQTTTITPDLSGENLQFNKEKKTPPAGVEPMAWTVDQYLSTLQAVPKEAHVLSCKVDNFIATVDFSKEIEAGYGTTDEQTLVNGVLTVMSQFKGVNAVKFTVEGKSIDTFGNIDLSEPQRVLKMPEN
jgi:hypothetical protein